MQKKLDSYKGPLSISQTARGMNAALRNAVRLAKDARLLLDADRLASAVSLAILSIEETGKISILRGLVFAENEQDLKAEWRRYRSHTSKNLQWTLPELAASGARSLDDMRPLFDEGSDHPQLLDQLKQIGFYTDCLGSNAHWSIPEKVIDSALAKTLVNTAEILSSGSPVTEREIALWVEHLGPVWKQSDRQMKQALIDWYRAMQEEGLKEAGLNAMEQFVRGGLVN
ncbi:AbiV family abortive infection protein [Pseudomonas fluorescens]|uniref:AbiV family abortive infection protein n=1 Tax=Pseudomonas fluorescens TaxID=294 RepID=UPI00223BFB21|nr:AbiV family abortive infection protein [Pseudomonas fluorescens]